jgi:hypothetical protein
MNERTERRGRAARAATVAVLGATVLAMTAAAFAELPAFGMTTVARRQRAVMHGVLTDPPAAGVPGCQVEASFVDAQGDVFRDAAGNPIRAQWDLAGSVAQSLSLRMADVLPDDQPRALIRAAVRETTVPPSPACCSLTLTLEIMNGGGGVTSLALPRWPNPPSPICVLEVR